MCSGAMLMSRVNRVCYAVPDPKMGCLGGATNLNDLPRVNHRVELTAGGVLEQECRELLQAYFKLKRADAWPAGPGRRSSCGINTLRQLTDRASGPLLALPINQ